MKQWQSEQLSSILDSIYVTLNRRLFRDQVLAYLRLLNTQKQLVLHHGTQNIVVPIADLVLFQPVLIDSLSWNSISVKPSRLISVDIKACPEKK